MNLFWMEEVEEGLLIMRKAEELFMFEWGQQHSAEKRKAALGRAAW
jgi:hypothetical protein